MDYYDESKAKKLLNPLKDNLTKMAKQKDGIAKRLDTEKGKLESLDLQREKLDKMAGESLAGDDNAYAKFKTSLRKLSVERETAAACIAAFETDVLPKAKVVYDDARVELQKALLNFTIKSRSAVEEKMSELVGRAVEMHDEFLNSLEELHVSFGEEFKKPLEVYPVIESDRLDSVHPRTTAGDLLFDAKKGCQTKPPVYGCGIRIRDPLANVEAPEPPPEAPEPPQDTPEATEPDPPVQRAGSELGDAPTSVRRNGPEMASVDSPKGRANRLGR